MRVLLSSVASVLALTSVCGFAQDGLDEGDGQSQQRQTSSPVPGIVVTHVGETDAGTKDITGLITPGDILGDGENSAPVPLVVEEESASLNTPGTAVIGDPRDDDETSSTGSIVIHENEESSGFWARLFNIWSAFYEAMYGRGSSPSEEGTEMEDMSDHGSNKGSDHGGDSRDEAEVASGTGEPVKEHAE